MNFELMCCGRKNPLGVDKQNIRLSFTLCGSVEIASCTVELRQADSDRLICNLPAEGMTAWVEPNCLKGLTGYVWRVIAVTATGETVASEQAYFETGPEHWQGKWIGGPDRENRTLEFQREICLDGRPKKARLYICGLGYFQPQLNENRLDESYFIPPVTDYAPRCSVDKAHVGVGHRITYYTYDVTQRLHEGSNLLQAEVAGGYFANQEKLGYEPQPDFSFDSPCLIYELHIQDQEGNNHTIVSDGETLVRCTNEISQLYSGDRIDFTEKLPEPVPAQIRPAPEGVMTAPVCQDDKLQKILTPVKSWETAEGTVYDFGVNHTGGLVLTVCAAEETELTIGYAEVLNSDGTLNYETAAWHGKHIKTGKTKHIYQQNTYRLKPGSQEIAPKFSWFCYRYVMIPANISVHIEKIQSLFICMDTEQDGFFRCSEELLNRINQMFLQTLYCNMHSGLVMDCPHRERLPYTGDGKLIMKSAWYNQDMIGFYYKWFQDMLDAQTADGLIPNSVPYLGGGGGYAWGNAICTVSKMLYAFTGDITVARRGYEAVGRWLSYYESKRDSDYVIRSNSHSWMLGDWLAPEVVTSDVYYISTVCYLQAAKTAVFFSEILDSRRREEWEALCDSIIKGINRVFFHEETCSYGNGVQGENMLALAEDIVPQPYRSRMEENLRQHYTVETDYHLDTGIVLTPVLLDYLTDHGHRDIAWRIMTAKTYPSYFSLMEDDTTFSEHWSKKWPDYYFGEPGNSRLVKGGGDLSHCHPMYGSVASWLYERVAGLDLTELYRGIIHVKPYFMAFLSWAEAKKKTAFGEVCVEWSREEGYTLKLSVPHGLTAACHFPAACKSLQNTATKQTYYPDEHGFYHLEIGPGQWCLSNLSDTEG